MNADERGLKNSWFTPRASALICGLIFLIGCNAPKDRLYFPTKPLEQTLLGGQWYDVNRDGKPDFALLHNDGRLDRVGYDDDQNGTIDRIYRLSEYSNESVPHVIVMLDSIGYQTVADRYAGGDFRWFDPPQKVIAPFPTLTEICFADLLHAPPMPGLVDAYYDPKKNEQISVVWARFRGFEYPWERRLHYNPSFLHQGYGFFHPKEWYGHNLYEAKQAVDTSPDRVTILYPASSAAVVCDFGKHGAEYVLDGLKQLCLELLYERRGAIKISVLADHGHNYRASKNVQLDEWIKSAGYRVTDTIQRDTDVVLELHGLVTFVGLVTRKPEPLAAALLQQHEVELAVYMENDRVIVRSANASAAIESQGRRVRYVPIEGDVLGYLPTIAALRERNLADADGYVDDDVWYHQTLDHAYPNAPRRVWDALHRQAVHAPNLLLVIRDGYSAGRADLEKYVKMLSTHGGLNQVNSATFVMSMTGRVTQPVQPKDVLKTLEPGITPRVLR